jgi:hypothetical protein
MGWLMVDFEAVRMDLIIGVFVKNFGRLKRSGVFAKVKALTPAPPGADRGMCLLMCRYESLVMIYVVLS